MPRTVQQKPFFLKIPRWVAPFIAVATIVFTIVVLTKTVFFVRSTINSAGLTPTDVSPSALFPTIDTEALRRLAPRLDFPLDE